MEYSQHKIKRTGHIELREEKEDGTLHRSVILPNQGLTKYNDIIEVDPDFEKYRTQENANAYETKLSSEELTEEEKLQQWRKSVSLSRRRFKIGEALYQVNDAPLKDSIATLLDELSEPQKTVATIAYKESGQFDRLDDFVVQFSTELGMTEEEADNFFRFCINEEWGK